MDTLQLKEKLCWIQSHTSSGNTRSLEARLLQDALAAALSLPDCLRSWTALSKNCSLIPGARQQNVFMESIWSFRPTRTYMFIKPWLAAKKDNKGKLLTARTQALNMLHSHSHHTPACPSYNRSACGHGFGHVGVRGRRISHTSQQHNFGSRNGLASSNMAKSEREHGAQPTLLVLHVYT